jgi:hypothetical protein
MEFKVGDCVERTADRSCGSWHTDTTNVQHATLRGSEEIDALSRSPPTLPSYRLQLDTLLAKFA